MLSRCCLPAQPLIGENTVRVCCILLCLPPHVPYLRRWRGSKTLISISGHHGIENPIFSEAPQNPSTLTSPLLPPQTPSFAFPSTRSTPIDWPTGCWETECVGDPKIGEKDDK